MFFSYALIAFASLNLFGIFDLFCVSLFISMLSALIFLRGLCIDFALCFFFRFGRLFDDLDGCCSLGASCDFDLVMPSADADKDGLSLPLLLWSFNNCGSMTLSISLPSDTDVADIEGDSGSVRVSELLRGFVAVIVKALVDSFYFALLNRFLTRLLMAAASVCTTQIFVSCPNIEIVQK